MEWKEELSAALWEQIRAFPLPPRVERLRADFQRRYRAQGCRLYTEAALVQARDAALLRAYEATAGQPPISRRAHALAEFAAAIPIRPEPDDLLLGSQAFNGPLPARLWELGYAATTGHIVHDYEGLLQRGIPGYQEQLAAVQPANEAAAITLKGFAVALEAFQALIRRHADAAAQLADALPDPIAREWRERAKSLRALMKAPPQTFAQALQLLWLAHLFLHAENPSVAISFGRIDQYLGPFLCRDLEAGRCSLEDAFALACAFLLKCCEGEESQNAVLGGVTATGEDAANPLSLLFLAAMRQMAVFQPSLSVRLHPGSPAVLVQAACELAASGGGNPGFMNDPVVIDGLQAVGIPREQARDWGIVGCYEATLPSACYPNTVLAQLHLVDILATYLGTDAARQAPTFSALLDGWYAHVQEAYRGVLADCQARWNHFRDQAPSPFGSLLMRGCVERALPLEAGGTEFNLVGINILGLGSVADSFYALRSLVYERGETTVAEIADAVAANFPDEELRQRLRNLPGRYGTDQEASNRLMTDISTTLAWMVLDSRLERGVRPYPAFFAFGADIYALHTASPDGRRKEELISYGVAPSAAVTAPPTAILASAAHAAQRLAACGSPLALTLTGADVQGSAGAARIGQLVRSYFTLGGSHVHFNIADADELRRAQETPEEHAQLMVRVSGYSARFVTVERQWQDALIARAAQGR